MKILLSLLMSVMFLVGQAAANDDNICDGEVGVAKGLCIVYCDSMDCESATQHASDKACDTVLAQYITLTGAYPPCYKQCPVWSEDELLEIYGEPCCDYMEDNSVIEDHDLYAIYDFCECGPPNPEREVFLGVATETDTGTGETNYIGFIYWFTTDMEDEIVRWIELTDIQHYACTNDILNHSFSQCTPPSD